MIILKRFDQGKKITNLVHFPIQIKGMNLKAVTEHRGRSKSSGHYVTKCWKQMMQKWYLIDEHVAKELEQRRLITENAYMLMYT